MIKAIFFDIDGTLRDFEEKGIPEYTRKTGLLFMLGFLNNFAANGRVSPAVAKIAGVLGIRSSARPGTWAH